MQSVCVEFELGFHIFCGCNVRPYVGVNQSSLLKAFVSTPMAIFCAGYC